MLLGNVAHHAVDGLGLVVPILTLSHLTRWAIRDPSDRTVGAGPEPGTRPEQGMRQCADPIQSPQVQARSARWTVAAAAYRCQCDAGAAAHARRATTARERRDCVTRKLRAERGDGIAFGCRRKEQSARQRGATHAHPPAKRGALKGRYSRSSCRREAPSPPHSG